MGGVGCTRCCSLRPCMHAWLPMAVLCTRTTRASKPPVQAPPASLQVPIGQSHPLPRLSCRSEVKWPAHAAPPTHPRPQPAEPGGAEHDCADEEPQGHCHGGAGECVRHRAPAAAACLASACTAVRAPCGSTWQLLWDHKRRPQYALRLLHGGKRAASERLCWALLVLAQRLCVFCRTTLHGEAAWEGVTQLCAVRWLVFLQADASAATIAREQSEAELARLNAALAQEGSAGARAPPPPHDVLGLQQVPACAACQPAGRPWQPPSFLVSRGFILRGPLIPFMS